jgi:hypothetical protein
MKRYAAFLLILFLFTGKTYSQERLKTDVQIPILAWYSILAAETSLERCKEMKDRHSKRNKIVKIQFA